MSDPYEADRLALSPVKVIVHDDWNPDTTSYDADLSLLVFEKGKIETSVYIEPICLWNVNSEQPLNEYENFVTGWVQSQDLSQKHGVTPKMAKVRVKDHGECFSQSKDLVELSNRTYCAGPTNGTGVCRGNSGSGLFVDVGGVNYLKGVSSSMLTNSNDCDVSKNAAYTNVLEFREWIDKKITDQGALLMEGIQASFLFTTNLYSAEAPEESRLPSPDEQLHCGTSHPEKLGGTARTAYHAQYAEFPWMMLVMNGTSFIGAGSLIHPIVVITAAHIIAGVDETVLKVRGGEYDIKSTDEIYPHVERKVDGVIVHQNFTRSNLRNNLALLLLTEAFTMTATIRTICLPSLNQNFEDAVCVTSGWGKPKFSNKKTYRGGLKKVSLQVVPHGRCEELLKGTRLGEDFILHEKFLCAGRNRIHIKNKLKTTFSLNRRCRRKQGLLK